MAQALQSAAKTIGSRINDVRRRPLADYYILLIVVGLLTVIGVTLVASSSMTWSVTASGNAWTTALRQTVMVILGLIACWVAMRVPPGLVRRFSEVFLGVSILLLVLVLTPLGTGYEQVGSQSWLVLGPLSFQPSEVARIAIAIWGASFLANREPSEKLMPRHLWTFFGVSGAMCALIVAEHDTGMAVTFLIVVFALAVFAGLDIRIMIGSFIGGIVVLIFLAMGGGYRGDRISVYLRALVGKFEDVQGAGYHSYQGFLSLADGSLTGVGLGQSRAKWFYLPEAKNDFIFAVVGEELGFIGAGAVVALFATLGVIGFRIAKRSSNMYLALLAAALTASVVVQAFVNISYVIGLVPVTGIQLPMISAGGTSAIITLSAMGLLLSCARHEPEAVSAMRSYGRPALDRVIGLPEPSLDDVVANKRHAPVRRPGHPGGAEGARLRERPGRGQRRPAPSREPIRGTREPQREAGRGYTRDTGSLNNRSRGPRPAPHRDRRRR